MLVERVYRAYRVRRRVMNAAAAEHEGVHAHAHVRAFGLDALPYEHARAFLALGAGHLAGLRTDLVTCA